MPICPVCSKQFDAGEQFCPRDGVSLRATPVPPDADPLVGRVVGGRYRLEEKLGQGGMGAVYRAVHVLMDKPFAVKVLKEGLAGEREAAARFHREARSASRLDHEYCIRVTDFGKSDDGLLYLAMELLSGQSLGREARKGPVAPTRAAAIGVAVAEGLQHAHDSGVIHRDLKPDNIFLARRSRRREIVKVLDFGLAKLVADGHAGSSITRDGTVFGTPEYMAPEQAEGENLDGRTDIYALGVILYQLLTGEVPFSASNFVALLTKQVSEPPQPLLTRKPDLVLPPGMAAVVMKCLEKRRDKRYTSAVEVADALWPFVDDAALATLSLPTRAEDNSRGGADSVISTQVPRADPTPTGPTVIPKSEPGPAAEVNAAETAPTMPRIEMNGGDSIAPTSLDGLSTDGVVARPKRRVALIAGALGLAAIVTVGAFLLPKPTEPEKPPVTTSADLDEVRRLIVANKLDEAYALLDRGTETAATLSLRSAIAEQRGERLNALGLLREATRIEPQNAEPHAQLASLLQRFGQSQDACKLARRALELDPSSARTLQARTVVSTLKCKD